MNALLNTWYPICQSAAVTRTPIGVRRLAKDLVGWRDAAGVVRVQSDICLHRGARLSLGVVVDNQIRCAYHGWTYDGSGRCTVIPSSREAHERLAPRIQLETYPSQERAGLVWAYFGDGSAASPPSLVIPEELEHPDWSGFICEAEWPVHWILILENLADPMHGPYLHSNSFTLNRGALEDQMRTIRRNDGFVVEREGQRGVNFDWAEFFVGGSLWVRLDIPLPWGPKGVLRICGMVTPIDDNASLVYFLRYRNLAGWKRAYWRFLYKVFWEQQHWKVIEQDRRMLESQRGELAHEVEHLINSDRGVTELRRVLKEKLASRLPAL